MNTPNLPSSTPNWSTNTKLVVGLTLAAIFAALFIYIRTLIGPLLLAFTLSYVLHPVVNRLSSTTRLNWRMAVNLVYLVVFILVGGFLTWSGLAIAQQIQSLIRIVQILLEVTLPVLAANLSTTIYYLGPFPIDLTQFNLQSLSEQVLGMIQPVLSQSATIIGTFATTTAVTLGWLLFILVISYFLLAEAGRVPDELFRIEIPGYAEDLRRLGIELQKIWNAFLRGQLIIFACAFVLTLIMLSILGLRFSLAIAIIAGVGKFIPYLGPLIVLVVAGVAALFQTTNIFGLGPWQFTLLTLVALVILDQSFDNMVTPRLLGRTLNLHPAAILVAALIAFNLIGIVGLILAAPVLATIKLLSRYTLRKMLDLDPWLESEQAAPPVELPWVWAIKFSKERWRALRKRLTKG